MLSDNVSDTTKTKIEPKAVMKTSKVQTKVLQQNNAKLDDLILKLKIDTVKTKNK